MLHLEAVASEVSEHEAYWKSEILEKVGAAAVLDIVYTESIPVLASGKRRFTLSKLSD